MSAEQLHYLLAPGPLALEPADWRPVPGYEDVYIYRSCSEAAPANAPASADWASLPVGYQPRLLVADLDSTLILEEGLDTLAQQRGVGAQVASITAAAMRGELDYQASFRERLRLVRGAPLAEVSELAQAASLRLGAEALFAGCRAAGIVTAIVSGGLQPAVAVIAQRLGADYYYGNGVEVLDGCLSGEPTGAILDAAAKRAHLERLCARLSIGTEQSVALGDGANDLLMLQSCGLAVGVNPKAVLVPHVRVCLRATGLHALLALCQDAGAAATR